MNAMACQTARRLMMAALLGSSALTLPAHAQTAESEGAGASAAQVEALQAQIAALQSQLDEIKKQLPKATPSWKGAPQWEDKAKGLSFKPRGRIHYDVGYVDSPVANNTLISPTQDLGFNSRIRRARIGMEGSVGGGFSYKAEADFANNAVSLADLYLEYKGKGPLMARVGHFYPFQSLDQMTSSAHIAFLERAQMTDAYGYGRRLGAAVGFDQGDVQLRAGVFNDTINGDLNNDEWMASARAVWAPKVGKAQLHLGLNAQYREFSNTALNARYRARPFVQTTGTRFVDSQLFGAESDSILGVEAAVIRGPFHVAGEAQWLKPNALLASETLPAGGNTQTSSRLAANPDFFSYYVEAGYWFTGESRGYKKGEWDRTRVKNGFDKGGPGAIGLNLRYDYLDMADRALYSGGIGTSLLRGGTQTGLLAALIWQPVDHVRITTQYGHVDVEGGPFAAIVRPASTAAVNDRSYGVDTVSMRFAVDW
jgi:phosphate-selective porin OprO and OprP